MTVNELNPMRNEHFEVKPWPLASDSACVGMRVLICIIFIVCGICDCTSGMSASERAHMCISVMT